MNILKNLIDEYNEKKSDIKLISVKKMEIASNMSDDIFLKDYYEGKIMELNQKQIALENELENIGIEIENSLSKIDNKSARQVIMMRIFTDSTWKYIARECNYSEARVRQLYRDGLSLLA